MLHVVPGRKRMRQAPTLLPPQVQPDRDPLATIAVSAASQPAFPSSRSCVHQKCSRGMKGPADADPPCVERGLMPERLRSSCGR
jgi:hypothetical protein